MQVYPVKPYDSKTLEGQLSRLDSSYHELRYSTNDMFIHKTRIHIAKFITEIWKKKKEDFGFSDLRNYLRE